MSDPQGILLALEDEEIGPDEALRQLAQLPAVRALSVSGGAGEILVGAIRALPCLEELEILEVPNYKMGAICSALSMHSSVRHLSLPAAFSCERYPDAVQCLCKWLADEGARHWIQSLDLSRIKPLRADCTALFDALRPSTSVQRIILDRVLAADSLRAMLQVNTSLQVLDFRRAVLGPKTRLALFQGLIENTAIRKLIAKRFRNGSEAQERDIGAALRDCYARNTVLEHLDCLVGTDEGQALAITGLEGRCSSRIRCLRTQCAGLSASTALCSVLSSPAGHPLRELRIVGSMPQEGLDMLASCIAENAGDLRSLRLETQPLKYASIVRSLATNTALRQLRLESASDGDGPLLEALAAGLSAAGNHTLRHLTLRACRINYWGSAEKLKEVLYGNVGLQSLDLSSNCIGGQGWLAAFHGIASNSTMLQLILDSNSLDGPGAYDAIRMLEGDGMQCLQVLDLADNGFTEGLAEDLQAGLRPNAGLAVIRLRGNRDFEERGDAALCDGMGLDKGSCCGYMDEWSLASAAPAQEHGPGGVSGSLQSRGGGMEAASRAMGRMQYRGQVAARWLQEWQEAVSGGGDATGEGGGLARDSKSVGGPKGSPESSVLLCQRAACLLHLVAQREPQIDPELAAAYASAALDSAVGLVLRPARFPPVPSASLERFGHLVGLLQALIDVQQPEDLREILEPVAGGFYRIDRFPEPPFRLIGVREAVTRLVVDAPRGKVVEAVRYRCRQLLRLEEVRRAARLARWRTAACLDGE